jgi:hypothetical protein
MLPWERNSNIKRSLLLIETFIKETHNGGVKLVENTLPKYEPPVVLTYTDEEILEELGPARAGSNGCQPSPHDFRCHG